MDKMTRLPADNSQENDDVDDDDDDDDVQSLTETSEASKPDLPSTEGTRLLPSGSSTRSPSISADATLLHFFKGFFGAGNLALPYAVARGGLSSTVVGIPVVGLISAYCIHCLVSASRNFRQFSDHREIDYAQTVELAFENGPARCRKFSKLVKRLINIMLCLQQLLILIVYVAFMGNNLREAAEKNFDTEFPVEAYIAFTLPLLILVNLIRDVSVLALVSGAGIAVQLVATIIILSFIVRDPLPLEELQMVETDPFKISVFVTMVICAYEGIVVVLPLENKMVQPEAMRSRFGVINVGVTLMTIFYITIAFFGYTKFGHGARDVVTLNLPHEPLYDSLKVIFSIVIVCTYAVQFIPLIEVVFGQLRQWIVHEGRVVLWEYLTRIGLVVLTVAIAAAAPHIGPLLSLLGAALVIPMTITFPVTIDSIRRISGDEKFGRLRWRLWVNIFLLIFSLLAMIIGTVASVRDLMERLNQVHYSLIY